jgi:Zn-dependent peptidase ImmA (M78 family)
MKYTRCMDLFDPWSYVGGIRIVRAPLPGDMLGCTNGETIWLDTDLDATEERCTLAHELVHIELGHTTLQPAHVEAHVERITARRLVPVEALAANLFHCLDMPALAERLDVTLDVLAERLRSLGESERLVIHRKLAEVFGPDEPLLEAG